MANLGPCRLCEALSAAATRFWCREIACFLDLYAIMYIMLRIYNIGTSQERPTAWAPRRRGTCSPAPPAPPPSPPPRCVRAPARALLRACARVCVLLRLRACLRACVLLRARARARVCVPVRACVFACVCVCVCVCANRSRGSLRGRVAGACGPGVGARAQALTHSDTRR